LPPEQQPFAPLLHAVMFLPQQDLPLAEHCWFLAAQQSLAEGLSLLPLLQQSMDLPWQQDILEEALSFVWSLL